MKWIIRLLMRSVINQAVADWHDTLAESESATEWDDKAYYRGMCEGIALVLGSIDDDAIPATSYEFVTYDEHDPVYAPLALSWSD